MSMRLWGLILVLCTSANYAQKSFLDSPENIQLFRMVRNWALNFFGRTSEEGRLLQNARDLRLLQDRVPRGQPFPCDVTAGRSPIPPSTVHKLRPGDIDVIAAMGDSLTAGFGALASDFLHAFIENRGITASGGGQGTWREFLTLPNIIKEFNPNLIGYALGDSFTFHKESQFNVAETGAMSKDTIYMAEILVKRIKSDPRVNLRKHWKLITFMIGPNDFCSEMCWISSPASVLKSHREDLLSVLRILRDHLPRTLVSLILAPSMKVLVPLKGRSTLCELVNDIECSCMFGLRWRRRRQEFFKIMEKWQDLEEEVSRLKEFQREDFAVVTQPFTANMSFPMGTDGRTDWSYFSTDCFHISQKGNARVANALWNNLLEPVGRKSRHWDDAFERFLCPTASRPFLATWGNRDP